MGRTRLASALAVAACLIVSLVLLTPAPQPVLGPDEALAQGGSPPCLMADPPPNSVPAHRLRFGITPQLAGSAGGTQGEVAPEDPVKALNALHQLQPRKRRLVMRMNRLFMSEGRAGIRRFAKLANRYRRAGFDVESQVRYHPNSDQEGDMHAWRAFVRQAATTLGRNRALVELTITNEVNLPLSSNTSDGAYEGALDAIVTGVPAARKALNGIGRKDVQIGLSYAWRYTPEEDAKFWQGIGERSTPAFDKALDHVGVQLYPGLFWPPVLFPGDTAGDETLEALTVVRDCYMPMAKLGDDVQLWITENGYPTNFGRKESRQVTDLENTVNAVHAYSGTLGVTDYRYFNLRDNRSAGSDLFDAVGLLREDYSRKPAFGAYRGLVSRYGRHARPRRKAGPLRLRLTLGCRRAGLRARVRGKDSAKLIRVAFKTGGKRVAVDRGRPFAKTIPFSRLGDGSSRSGLAAVKARALSGDGRRLSLRKRRSSC